jgi:hypothetical protein
MPKPKFGHLMRYGFEVEEVEGHLARVPGSASVYAMVNVGLLRFHSKNLRKESRASSR